MHQNTRRGVELLKRFCLLAALLLLLFTGALAESGQTVITLKLSEETLQNENKAYVKDGRTYIRDMTAPVVDGLAAMKVTQTSAAATYICPVDADSAEAVLHLPYSAAFTTVEVDGQLLSCDAPVTVRAGDKVLVRVASAHNRSQFYIYFTTMPVAVIQYEGYDLYANNVSGSMTLYDPYYVLHGQSEMAYTTPITIGYRGQSSLDYEKHNYSVHLKDAQGENRKASLLGMRKDDDWVLSGAMNDQLRVRNMVAMRLWDEFYTLPWSQNFGGGSIQGEFCEVFLNGKYIGLHCLSEKLDRKQAELDKENGRIVRSVEASKYGVNIMSFTQMGTKPPEGSTWYNMEIKYPKEEDVQTADWDEFYAFIDFVNKSSDEEFAAEIGNYIDIDNFASYYVYITAIGATGNMNKNLYFVMEDAAKEDAKWFLVPWDVDGSFGRRNNAAKREVDILSSNQLFERLIATNAQGFADLIRQKWNAHKDGVFSYENMMAHFSSYYDTLEAQGAWTREKEKWPSFKEYYWFDAEKEYRFVQEYMKARWDFVDSYFNGDNLSAGKWLYQ